MSVRPRRHNSYAKAMDSPITFSHFWPPRADDTIDEDEDFPPDIIIPPPLFNPLPLQCLAADALPDTVKREIEGVLDDYLEILPPPPVYAPEPVQELDTERKVTVKREVNKSQLANDLGLGVKIMGGLQCGCGSLHAVVMDITDTEIANPVFQEGVCVVQWNGDALEGCSYEQVKKALSTSADKEEVEVVVKECSKLKLAPAEVKSRKYSVRAFLKDQIRLNEKKVSEESLLCKSLQQEANQPAKSNSPLESVNRLDSDKPPDSSNPLDSNRRPLVAFDKPQMIRSVSVTAARTVNGPITQLESDYLAKSPSTPIFPKCQTRPAILPKSPTTCGIDKSLLDFFANLSYGMVKLSLRYREERKTLSIRLDGVKGHSSHTREKSEVFINTYLIPDIRGHGVRYSKVNDPRLSHIQLSTYEIGKNELDSVALRVILWEGGQKQKVSFRGEVLLGLSDGEIVSLNGESTWYTLSAEDPNLPPLPNPVHKTEKHGTDLLFTRIKQKVSSTQALGYFKQHSKKQKAPSQTTTSSSEVPPESQLTHVNLTQKWYSAETSSLATSSTHRGNFGSFSLDRESQLMAGRQCGEDSSEASSAHSSLTRRSHLAVILDILRDDSPSREDYSWFHASDTDETIDHQTCAVSPDGVSNLDHAGRARVAKPETNSEKPFMDEDSLKTGTSKPISVDSFHNLGKKKEENKLASSPRVSFVRDPLLEALEENKVERSTSSTPESDFSSIDGSLDDPSVAIPCMSSVESDEISDSSSVQPTKVTLRVRTATLERKLQSLSSSEQVFQDSEESTRSLIPPLQRPRSRSVGDILGLCDEDGQNTKDVVPISVTGERRETSTLDGKESTSRRQHTNHSKRAKKKFSLPTFGAGTGDSHHLKPPKSSMNTWRSFDDLLESIPVPRALSKRSSSRKSPTTPSPSTQHSLPDTSRQVCSIKLEFLYSPSQPRLVVELVDVVCSSPKATLDFTFKATIYHSGTGVCLLKKKSDFSLGRTSLCPLTTLQFDVDVTNLSLHVCLIQCGKLRSRRSMGQLSIDLNSLDLRYSEGLTKWFTLNKPQ